MYYDLLQQTSSRPTRLPHAKNAIFNVQQTVDCVSQIKSGDCFVRSKVAKFCSTPEYVEASAQRHKIYTSDKSVATRYLETSNEKPSAAPSVCGTKNLNNTTQKHINDQLTGKCANLISDGNAKGVDQVTEKQITAMPKQTQVDKSCMAKSDYNKQLNSSIISPSAHYSKYDDSVLSPSAQYSQIH